MANSARTVRVPVRWAGSKAKLLPVIRKIWPAFSGRYIEAFAGSASFFFNLAPREALLNDTNVDLMLAYKVLKESPKALYFALCDIDVLPGIYYKIRERFCFERDEFERSVAFFYLNRYSFNGIYRTNKQGMFNVPFGGHRTGNFPSLEEWVYAADLLKRAKIECLDFENAVKKHARAGDLIYLDPPYAVSNRRVFVQYSAHTFGQSDIDRLKRLMIYLNSIGSKFIVSYAYSPEGMQLSKGWKTVSCFVQRNIAGFARHRGLDREILITNY